MIDGLFERKRELEFTLQRTVSVGSTNAGYNNSFTKE